MGTAAHRVGNRVRQMAGMRLDGSLRGSASMLPVLSATPMQRIAGLVTRPSTIVCLMTVSIDGNGEPGYPSW